MSKVLIIEDDEALYSLYSTELELSGFKVFHHATGGGAVEKAKEIQPDIILLDIMLPEKDGIKILGELKKEEETKKIPVIMLTNFGSDENVRRALEGGAEDFILKYKIVSSEVAQKIKQILEGH